MARLIRNASYLKRSVLSPAIFRQGLLGTSSQISNFATKGKKKSVASDSGDENLSQKDLALKQALEQIKASFGSGAIMWLGRSEGPKEVPVVSTGSFALDIALGIGGFPKGRVVEIFGPEASGKTTLALHVIAEAQKHGGYPSKPILLIALSVMASVITLCEKPYIAFIVRVQYTLLNIWLCFVHKMGRIRHFLGR